MMSKDTVGMELLVTVKGHVGSHAAGQEELLNLSVANKDGASPSNPSEAEDLMGRQRWTSMQPWCI